MPCEAEFRAAVVWGLGGEWGYGRAEALPFHAGVVESYPFDCARGRLLAKYAKGWAPVGSFGIRNSSPAGRSRGIPPLRRVREGMGHPSVVLGFAIQAQRDGAVESQPFAEYAKGWGTRR